MSVETVHMGHHSISRRVLILAPKIIKPMTRARATSMVTVTATATATVTEPPPVNCNTMHSRLVCQNQIVCLIEPTTLLKKKLITIQIPKNHQKEEKPFHIYIYIFFLAKCSSTRSL